MTFRWQIRIPYRSRADSLVDVIGATRHLEGDKAAVAREIAQRAQLGGLRTAGELIDRLEATSKAERRQLLDSARQAVGLERSEKIDDREAFEGAQRVARLRASGRDAAGRLFTGCAAEGCRALPSDPATGLPVPVADRRWWCPEHRHLAEPEDHLPPEDVTTIGPHFEEISAPSIQRAEAARDEERRRADRRRAEEGTHEARERAEVERLRNEQFERELPESFRS